MHKRAASFLGGLMALLCIGSCSGPFRIPQKIVVKGNPAFALPLGSVQLPIDEYLSIEAIRDTMGENSGILVYDYAPEEDAAARAGKLQVQTYLIHFLMDSLEFDLSADQFGFNKDGAIRGPNINIPSMDKVSNSIFLPVPLGGLSPGMELPLSVAGNSMVTLAIDDDDFIKAEVGEGYLVLSGGEVDVIDFSKVTIEIRRPGLEAERELFPQKVGTEWRYDLAGVTLSRDTTMYLRGSIIAGGAINTERLRLSVSPKITELSKVTVRSTTTQRESIPVKFADPENNWIKNVAFSRTGVRLKVKPRIDGLTMEINSPVLGIDHVSQTMGADNWETGLEYAGANSNIGWSNFNIDLTVKSEELTLYDIRPGDKDFAIIVEPESLFEWESITVNLFEMPENKKPQFAGTFPGEGNAFDLSSLTAAFEDSNNPNKILFDKVSLHLFIDGPPEIIDTISIKMSARYGENNEDLTRDPVSGNPYAKPRGDGKIPDFETYAPDQVYRGEKLDDAQLELNLTNIFNAKADLVLDYSIQLANKEITIPRGDSQSIVIRPDIIVELPLAFLIQADDPASNMAALALPGMLGDEDLFGRPDPNPVLPEVIDPETGLPVPQAPAQSAEKDDSSNEIADMLKTVTLDLTYTNTMAVGVRLMGENFSEPKPILNAEQAGRQRISFNQEELAYPFVPEIEVFVPLNAESPVLNGKPYGRLEIGRGTEGIPMGITLSLSVTVETDLNIEL
ncbi:MAG: hypothetical protein LBQ38_07130 [Spirochaetaceae bacterium]|jgi:hypothetical protein|nr:hypothetical protein [Spirochaetaceae bacterium]